MKHAHVPLSVCVACVHVCVFLFVLVYVCSWMIPGPTYSEATAAVARNSTFTSNDEWAALVKKASSMVVQECDVV